MSWVVTSSELVVVDAQRLELRRARPSSRRSRRPAPAAPSASGAAYPTCRSRSGRRRPGRACSSTSTCTSYRVLPTSLLRSATAPVLMSACCWIARSTALLDVASRAAVAVVAATLLAGIAVVGAGLSRHRRRGLLAPPPSAAVARAVVGPARAGREGQDQGGRRGAGPGQRRRHQASRAHGPTTRRSRRFRGSQLAHPQPE